MSIVSAVESEYYQIVAWRGRKNTGRKGTEGLLNGGASRAIPVKGSNQAAKAKLSMAKLHQRIADQRAAVLHELSDPLTRNYQTIYIEG